MSRGPGGNLWQAMVSSDAFDSASALLDSLNSASAKPKPLVRATLYAAYPDGSGGRADVDSRGQQLPESDRAAALTAVRSRGGHVLESWKVQEYAYGRHADSIFKVFPRSGSPPDIPTLARGLFTEKSPSGSARIVLRGYDKFFNVNEMPWTRVRAQSTSLFWSLGPGMYTNPFCLHCYRQRRCIGTRRRRTTLPSRRTDASFLSPLFHLLSSLSRPNMGSERLTFNLLRPSLTQAPLKTKKLPLVTFLKAA